jgi:hypothetical protein
MKSNKFFIVIMLGAIVLSGTSFQMQASQSWYDWGTSGIRSGLRSSYQTMSNMIPSSTGISSWAANFVNMLNRPYA